MPAGDVDAIPEGMLVGEVLNVDLDGDGRADGFQISVRNQFFHGSHPLGWFRDITVTVDGETLPTSQTYLGLRGQLFRCDSLRSILEVFWKEREIATILVVRQHGLSAGSHRIACSIGTSVQAYTRALDLFDVRERGTLVLEQDFKVSGEMIALRGLL